MFINYGKRLNFLNTRLLLVVGVTVKAFSKRNIKLVCVIVVKLRFSWNNN